MGLSFLVALVAPLYGAHAQPVDHRTHLYTCQAVPEASAKPEPVAAGAAPPAVPAYADFCDTYVSAAVTEVKAGGGFLARLMPSWDAKIDAAVKRAQTDAADAYVKLQTRYLMPVRSELGDLSAPAVPPEGSLASLKSVP